MGINNRLYDRGHEGYDKSIGSKLLYVDGLLPTASKGYAYEGRLQIHNNIGACSVEIVSSENLPDGASVYVDNSTSQVVITWPAKNVEPMSLVNPSFETGDLTGWSYETKGGSGILTTSSNYKDVGIYSAYWAGGRGLGSEGGIECLAINDAKGPVNPGDMVTAKLRVMYNPGGGTPKGSRGQARLQWYDSSDNLLKVSEGFLIKTRAYNGKWTDTVVSDRAVPNSAYVRLAGWVTATGAGHTYFDSAEWSLPTYIGTDSDATVSLNLQVKDASGRLANWSGEIFTGDFATYFRNTAGNNNYILNSRPSVFSTVPTWTIETSFTGMPNETGSPWLIGDARDILSSRGQNIRGAFLTMQMSSVDPPMYKPLFSFTTSNSGVFGSGERNLLSSVAVAADSKTHVAVTRNASGLYRMWVNGVLSASLTDTANVWEPSTPGVSVGTRYDNSPSVPRAVCWVALTQGTEKYTSNFTPPAKLEQLSGFTCGFTALPPVGSTEYYDPTGNVWTPTQDPPPSILL